MFTSIRLRNFKSYRDSRAIPLAPLTVIVGQNNAGKSSILHAILMLKQTLQDKNKNAPLITSGPFAELGGFRELLHGKEVATRQTITIDLATLPQGMEVMGLPGEKSKVGLGTDLSVTFSFDARANRIRVAAVKLSRQAKAVIDVKRAGSVWEAGKYTKAARKHGRLDFLHFLPRLNLAGKKPKSERDAKLTLALSLLLHVQAEVWSQLFEEVRHIAPLRLPVPWFAMLGKTPSSDLGTGGENLLRVLADETQRGKTKQRIVKLVDEWMSKRFAMLKKLRLVDVDSAGTVRSLVADETDGFKAINVAAMGEGLSQMLPIVARVLMGRTGECLLVEQPEIHLHPRAQADLADLFVDNIRQSKNRQYIVETHSEHLLLRVRRRVAEGRISPDKVGVLYVERRGQESVVRRLKLNGKGHFDDWPEGFFEEGYQEALKLAEVSTGARGKAK
ncbi:MAG: DUF3696 domain-containing protein [Planctomycetes bacterium]|nr:DUF3696 domain-containing protein [Planctomycetota bacterium]